MVLNTLQYRIQAEDDTEQALRSFGANAERTFSEVGDEAERIGDRLQNRLDEGLDMQISDESIDAAESKLTGMFARVSAALAIGIGAALDGLDRYEQVLRDLDFAVGGNATQPERGTVEALTRTGAISTEAAQSAVGALRGQYGNLGIAEDQAGVVALFLASMEQVEAGTSRDAVRTLNRFGVEGAGDIISSLDLLYRQSSGAGVSLSEVFRSFEGDARALPSFGFGLPQATELIVDSLNFGIDFGAIGGGLEEAGIQAGERGIDPLTALQGFVREIRRAPPDQKLQTAAKYFGETDAYGVVEALEGGAVGFGRELVIDRDRLPEDGLVGAVGLTTQEAGAAILDSANFTGGVGAWGSQILQGVRDLPLAGDIVGPLINAVATQFGEPYTPPGDLYGATFTDANSRHATRLNEANTQLYGLDLQAHSQDVTEYSEGYDAERIAMRDEYARRLLIGYSPDQITPQIKRYALQRANEAIGITVSGQAGGGYRETVTRQDDYTPPAPPAAPSPLNVQRVTIVADETEDTDTAAVTVKLDPFSIAQLAAEFSRVVVTGVPPAGPPDWRADPTTPTTTPQEQLPIPPGVPWAVYRAVHGR